MRRRNSASCAGLTRSRLALCHQNGHVAMVTRVLHLQELSERMRSLAVDADARQTRVSQLEAQLLEALSRGADHAEQAAVEV